MDVQETLLEAPTSIMAKLVWDRLLLLKVSLLAVAWGPPLLEARYRMLKDPKMAREALWIGKEPSSLQCFRYQGWGHMAWECATPAKTLNQSGGNQGNVPQPPTGTSYSSQQYVPSISSLTLNQNQPSWKQHKRKDDQRPPLSLFLIMRPPSLI